MRVIGAYWNISRGIKWKMKFQKGESEKKKKNKMRKSEKETNLKIFTQFWFFSNIRNESKLNRLFFLSNSFFFFLLFFITLKHNQTSKKKNNTKRRKHIKQISTLQFPAYFQSRNTNKPYACSYKHVYKSLLRFTLR